MADQNATERQLRLERLYVKKLSFESPKTPEAFTTNTDAETLLNIRSVSQEVDANRVEVTLSVKVRVVAADQDVFSVEVDQAGIFVLTGFTPDERFTLLGTHCPETLYPYAREVVSDIVDKAGFPQLLVQPLDFTSMFAQNMRERAAAAQMGGGSDPLAASDPTGASALTSGPAVAPDPGADDKPPH